MGTKFRTRINVKASKGEVQKDRTLITEPDHSKSMRDILKVYATTGIVPTSKQAVFNGNHIVPDLTMTDHLDRFELAQEAKNVSESLKNEVYDKKKELSKRKLEIAKQKAVDEDKKTNPNSSS